MEILSSYDLIITASVIIILSFIFGEVARKTNVPSVLMLIVLGIILQVGVKAISEEPPNFLPLLEILGIVGLIMIVLEAALELKLEKDKYWSIAKALGVALLGLIASTFVAAMILQYFIEGMEGIKAWIYATPLSILSSAIIIPSVIGLREDKKEFHIYESTFSDILGIMMFYFLIGQVETAEHSGGGATGFGIKVLLTIVLSLIASYLIVIIFQNIKSHTKLFLMIAVLLLLYAVGKKMHLSSLIIILVFGLLIANMKLFFRGRLRQWLDYKQVKEIYEGLHIITMETAFVVRTFFFVIFGLTIALSSIADLQVAIVSILIIISIYAIRFLILRITIGKDILPQLFIAPRGLITILLFYKIPENVKLESFSEGVLLFIIIGTSIIMTFALVQDKRKTTAAIRRVKENPIGYEKWKAPNIQEKS